MDTTATATALDGAGRLGMGGGASNDAGTDHRAGIAAYLAAAALSDHSVVDDTELIPLALDLETGDATDDIRCEMRDGTNWYIQAKRTGRLGAPFDDTAAQWARQDLLPGDQVVMGSSHFSGPLRDASEVLTYGRYRRGQKPSKRAEGGLATVLARAAIVDRALPQRVKESARFFRCDTGDDGGERRLAEAWLEAIIGPGHGPAAFATLSHRFVLAARRQERTTIEDWLDALAQAGHSVAPDRHGTGAQHRALLRRAVVSYRSSLGKAQDRLDLSTLAPGMPVVEIEDLLGAWGLAREPASERNRDSEGVYPVARRNKRLLVTGLPGMGKSTMLAQLAARLAQDEDAPLPIFVRFADIAENIRHADDVSIDLLARLAAQRVNAEHRRDVAHGLVAEILGGTATFLIDGLDETFACLGRVLSGLTQLILDLPRGTGWVLTSREDAARAIDAASLEMLPASLQFTRGARDTVHEILRYEATRQGVPAEQVAAWVRLRSSWYSTSSRRSEDSLLGTPMHVALMASHVARHAVTDHTIVDLLPVVLRERAGQQLTLESAAAFPGGWDSDLRTGMALDVLVALGHALSDTEVLDASEAELVASKALSAWQLSSRVERNIARQLIWYWDERAAVLKCLDGRVRARSRRWVDAADALWLQEQDADVVADWVRGAVASEGRLDAVHIAAALVPTVVTSLREVSRGAGMSLDNAVRALLAWIDSRDLGGSDTEGLQVDLFSAASRLPSSATRTDGAIRGRLKSSPLRPDDVRAAAAALPIRAGARGARDLLLNNATWQSPAARDASIALALVVDAGIDGDSSLPTRVMDLLATTLQAPPTRTAPKVNPRTGSLEIGGGPRATPGLGELALHIARFDAPLTSELLTWLHATAKRSRLHDFTRISEVLSRRGSPDPNPRSFLTPSTFDGLKAISTFFAYNWLLQPLSETASNSDRRDLWRLEETADLVQVLLETDTAVGGAAEVLAAPSVDVQSWLEVMMKAIGSNPQRVANEAAYVLGSSLTEHDRGRVLVCERPDARTADPKAHFDASDWQRAEACLASDIEWITDSAADLFLRAGRTLAEPVGQDAPGRNAYSAFNTAYVELSVLGDPDTVSEFLSDGRPAARQAAAQVAYDLREEALMGPIRQACLNDADWTIRVTAGADQNVAEGAREWSCRHCEHINAGVEAHPCDQCGSNSRPSARAPRAVAAE